MSIKKERRQRQEEQHKLLQLLANMELDASMWLYRFMDNDFVMTELPKLKISSALSIHTYGRYAINAIQRQQQKLETMFNAGNITEEQYNERLQLLQQKTTQAIIKRPLQAAFTPDYCITFYPNVIKSIAAQNNCNYEQHWREIMVHEMFHAYHYWQLAKLQQNTWSVDSSLTSKVNTVKEALACYAQYAWLTEHNLEAPKVSLCQDACADYHCYPSYPYAGLKAILQAHDANAKFKTIYQLSLHNWQAAYQEITQNCSHILSHISNSPAISSK